MPFSMSREGIIKLLKERQGSIQNANNESLRLQRKAAEEQSDISLLPYVNSGWRSCDPGKNGEVVFFLQHGQRVVIRELLQEGEECQTTEEWNEHYKSRKWYLNYEKVPPHYSVVNFSEVDTRECPHCHTLQPLLEHYTQTLDSPEGDEWLKEYLVFCFNCIKPTVLQSRTSPHRF